MFHNINCHSRSSLSHLLLKGKNCCCCCSVTQSCPTLCDPWTAAHLSFIISLSLLKLTSIQSMMLSNRLILCGPFLLCLQSFPASGYSPMSWLFTSGGQSIGASSSASVLPMNIQDWFPLELTGLISLQLKKPSRVFSLLWKHHFFGAQPSLWSNCHIRMTTGKTIALTLQTSVTCDVSVF